MCKNKGAKAFLGLRQLVLRVRRKKYYLFKWEITKNESLRDEENRKSLSQSPRPSSIFFSSLLSFTSFEQKQEIYEKARRRTFDRRFAAWVT